MNDEKIMSGFKEYSQLKKDISSIERKVIDLIDPLVQSECEKKYKMKCTAWWLVGAAEGQLGPLPNLNYVIKHDGFYVMVLIGKKIGYQEVELFIPIKIK